MNCNNDDNNVYNDYNDCNLLNMISNEQLKFILSFLSPKTLAICQR